MAAHVEERHAIALVVRLEAWQRVLEILKTRPRIAVLAGHVDLGKRVCKGSLGIVLGTDGGIGLRKEDVALYASGHVDNIVVLLHLLREGREGRNGEDRRGEN